MTLEELNRSFVLFRCLTRFERAEVSPVTCFRVLLSRIKAIFA